MPEPVTTTAVAAAIGAIVAGLGKLFGGGDIAKYIEEIIDKLNELEELLEDIRDDLQRLRVYIDTSFVNDAEKQLIARIRAYTEIAGTLHGSALSKEAKQQLAMDYLREIQFARNKLAAYSYASFATMLYSMAPEQDLCAVAGIPLDTRLSIADSYQRYFQTCSDAATAQTPAERQNSASATLQTLKAAHPDCRDKMIEAFFIHPFSLIPFTRSYKLTSAHYVFTGSLDSEGTPAFSGAIHKGDFFRNPVPIDSPILEERPHVPWHEAQRRFRARLANWNAAQAPYRAAKVQLPALEAAVSAVAVCLTESKKMKTFVESTGNA